MPDPIDVEEKRDQLLVLSGRIAMLDEIRSYLEASAGDFFDISVSDADRNVQLVQEQADLYRFSGQAGAELTARLEKMRRDLGMTATFN